MVACVGDFIASLIPMYSTSLGRVGRQLSIWVGENSVFCSYYKSLPLIDQFTTSAYLWIELDNFGYFLVLAILSRLIVD